ncbi:MAG: transcriptional repressor, partial [Bdellovibrio sp.]
QLMFQKVRAAPLRGWALMLQYILDHSDKQMTLKEINDFLESKTSGVDRSSIYRNLESFKKLEIIREIKAKGVKKQFQYIFDQKIHDYFICKSCGKLVRGKRHLFIKIETALKAVPEFSDTGLSIVFYGHCPSCKKTKKR